MSENKKTAREIELEDLLTSARAIAKRKGENTAWERFSARLKAAGIGSVTAKTFRALPGDESDHNACVCKDENGNPLNQCNECPR